MNLPSLGHYSINYFIVSAKPSQVMFLRHSLLAILSALFMPLCFANQPKVILHLLDHTDKAKTENQFWIDWKNSYRPIIETKTVEGDSAVSIISLLKSHLSPQTNTTFCGHDPIYGIIATNESGQTLKTSLCFKCLTWVAPKERFTMKGQVGINNQLCLLLRKHIELPRDLLEKQQKQSVK